MSELNLTKLSDVATIIMGQSPSSDSYNEKKDGVPFFQGNADFGDSTPIVRYYCNQPNKMAQINDILISVRAPIGAINIANIDCCIGRGLSAIRAKENICYYKYLYYVLIFRKSDLIDKGTGSTFKAINKDTINELLIPIFDYKTQKLIVELLDKSYSFISIRKKQIEELDNLIKSIFYDMFGDPLSNTKKWSMADLDDYCNKITDGEHKTPIRTSSGIYLLSARNILNHSLQLYDVDYIDDVEYKRISKRIVPGYGDILISCSGSVGRVCRVKDNLKFQMVRSVAILQLKEILNSIFIEYLFDTNYMQFQILNSLNKSSQANLFQGKIRQLKIIVPPIELQNKFAECVLKIEQQKILLQQSLEQMELNYKSLMQRAFNGTLF